MKLSILYHHLQHDLALIEKELSLVVKSEHPPLAKASAHYLQAGGKRIRPVFVLLAARFGDYNFAAAKKIAVALELIHMATLIHDDVIDDAETRRGQKTIKSRWNNRVAMYTGDFVFARALEIVSELKQPEIHRNLSKALVEISIGEIEQIRCLYDWNQSLRTYLRRIRRKTALLIAASCSLGALSANAPECYVKNLYAFGYHVGMSFQITDDILDFTANERVLGKPVGHDLRQGNITLPVLYALWQGDKKPIIDYLSADKQDNAAFQKALTTVKSSGGIAYARNLSRKYLHKAYQALSCLPDSQAKKSLSEIAHYIGKRNY